MSSRKKKPEKVHEVGQISPMFKLLIFGLRRLIGVREFSGGAF